MNSPVNYDVLNTIIPRLWTTENGQTVLAMEFINGPYKGVVFSYMKFEVRHDRTADGMVPTKFETHVWSAPPGFYPDEEFDNCTAELIVAWLAYINLVDMRVVVNAVPHGVVQ